MSSSPQPLPFSESEIPTEEALVAAVGDLVSPPVVCMKIMALVNSPKSSADDFAGLISTDPNLTLRVLRIVNSAYYGFRSEIDTLSRAVTILGVRDLSNIVLAIAGVRTFSSFGGGLVDRDTFWHHSVYVALAARRLARIFAVEQPERLFIAGLLHEVGSAVLYGGKPQLADWMRTNAGLDEFKVSAHERSVLDFTHATLGARLLESWELPVVLRGAIESHHEDAPAGAQWSEQSLLVLAERIAAASSLGSLDPDEVVEAPAGLIRELTGNTLGETEIEAMLEGIAAEFTENMNALRAD